MISLQMKAQLMNRCCSLATILTDLGATESEIVTLQHVSNGAFEKSLGNHTRFMTRSLSVKKWTMTHLDVSAKMPQICDLTSTMSANKYATWRAVPGRDEHVRNLFSSLFLLEKNNFQKNEALMDTHEFFAAKPAWRIEGIPVRSACPLDHHALHQFSMCLHVTIQMIDFANIDHAEDANFIEQGRQSLIHCKAIPALALDHLKNASPDWGRTKHRQSSAGGGAIMTSGPDDDAA